ncbi:hypothetical protein GCM10028828_20410 [Corynebacterium tapiri]
MVLARALVALGESVLVLDSDKQRSATEWADDAGPDLGFEVMSVPTGRTLQSAIDRYRASPEYSYLIVDTPPGSDDIVDKASVNADLVLVPTGVSPLDMKRTQATLNWFEDNADTPVAVVLTNVDKREKLLDLAQETLSSQARAALADTIIPTRSATRRVGSTVPRVTTKPFREWMELAEEVRTACREL